MMKKITRIAALLAATALLFGAIGCSDSDDNSNDGSNDDGDKPKPETPAPEQGSATNYDFADLTADDFATLGVTVTGSNDIKIATPNNADTPYLVLGGKVGIVTTAASKLSVKPKNDAPVAIGFNTNGLNQTANNTTAVGETVTIDHFITYPVEAGKKYQLAITSGGQANNTAHYFVVTDTTGKILASKACSSSTTDAVTLDAFDATEAVIRLTVHRSNSSGTSYVGKVTITEINTEVKVSGITVTAPEDSDNKVTVNKTVQLTAAVTPENATSKGVEWTSSDESKATVSTSGVVTGIAAGEVEITATATDGSEVKGKITLTVVAGTDTVTPDAFTLTSGAAASKKSFTLALGTTQINAAGLAALKANTDLTAQIAGIVTQSAGDNITVSALTVAEDATATTLKLSVTMASSAAADTTGTLSLTLPADYTANNTAITKTINYTIEAAQEGVAVDASFIMESNIGAEKALGAVNSSAADLDADITAEAGSTGATLHFKGNTKVESNDLNVQKTTGVTTEIYATGDSKVAKGFFELVLSNSAIVKVHYKPSSNGSDTARIIGITKVSDDTETKIQSADVSQTTAAEADFVTDSKLEAGTYKIYCNGVKIYSIKCGAAAEAD